MAISQRQQGAADERRDVTAKIRRMDHVDIESADPNDAGGWFIRGDHLLNWLAKRPGRYDAKPGGLQGRKRKAAPRPA